MKNKVLLFLFLAAAWVAFNAATAWAQGTPEKGTKEKSVGGSQSERTGGDSQIPGPAKGTSESEKGIGQSGVKEGKAPREGTAQDKSIGGTQAQRQQEQQTPMPGTSQTEMEKGKMPSDRAARGERRGAEGEARGGRGGERLDREQVKLAQEALKNKGHDPGPIDGVVGPKTREAIKQFQSASGLKETGRLDQETAQKLGIDKGAAPKEARETKEPGAKGQPESSPMPKEPSPMGK